MSRLSDEQKIRIVKMRIFFILVIGSNDLGILRCRSGALEMRTSKHENDFKIHETVQYLHIVYAAFEIRSVHDGSFDPFSAGKDHRRYRAARGGASDLLVGRGDDPVCGHFRDHQCAGKPYGGDFGRRDDETASARSF